MQERTENKSQNNGMMSRFLALVAQEIKVVILWGKDDKFVTGMYGQWFMGRAEGGSVDVGYLIWRQGLSTSNIQAEVNTVQGLRSLQRW